MVRIDEISLSMPMGSLDPSLHKTVSECLRALPSGCLPCKTIKECSRSVLCMLQGYMTQMKWEILSGLTKTGALISNTVIKLCEKKGSSSRSSIGLPLLCWFWSIYVMILIHFRANVYTSYFHVHQFFHSPLYHESRPVRCKRLLHLHLSS